MSLLAGLSQQASALTAHNADATAHSVDVSAADVSAVKTGSAINQATLAQSEADAPSFIPVPITTAHAIREVTGFRPVGVTNDGQLCIVSTTDTSLMRVSSDGFATYKDVRLNMGLSSLWFDSAGNAYASGSQSVYRATAGGWAFIKCFDFELASGTAAQYSHATDLGGGVYVAQYTTSTTDAGTQIWYSHDYGESWTSVTVDYGQRHFHGIYFHTPTNTLYVLAGEAPLGDADLAHGRKLLKSLDRGATWSVAFSFGDSADASTYGNPVAINTVNGMIVLGADGGTYGGLFVVDPNNDSLPPRWLEVRVDSWRQANSGYIFQTALDCSGNLLIPPEYNSSNLKKVAPLMLLPRREYRLISLLSPFVTRQKYTATIYGPDASGNFAILSTTSTTLILRGPTPKVGGGIVTSDSSGFVGNFVFNSNVISGQTLGGAALMTFTTSFSTATNYLDVEAGKKYVITTAIRRVSATATNLLREIRWFNGETWISNVQEYLRLSRVKAGGYHSITSHVFTAPANATRMIIRMLQTNDTDNSHVCSTVTSLFDADTFCGGAAPWCPLGAASESAEIAIPAGRALVNRIYSRGVPNMAPKDKEIQLFTVGNAVVSTINKTASVDGDYHIRLTVGGNIVMDEVGALWGSEIGVAPIVPNAGDPNEFLAIRGVSCPLIVAVLGGQICVINPETGSATTANFSGGSYATALGNCVHVPLVIEAKRTLEELARDFI